MKALQPKDIQICPQCKGETLKLVIWRPRPGNGLPMGVNRVMETFGVNCIREWKCSECGFGYKE